MISNAWAAAGTQTQSFWAYLSALVHGVDGQLLLVSFMCVFFGLFSNYMVKWAKDEIVGGFWCYLMHQTPRRTVLSLVACVSAIAAMFTSNVFWNDDIFIGWSKVIIICFLTGYTLDNSINKSERKQWTDADREAKAAIVAAENHPNVPLPVDGQPPGMRIN